MFSNKNYKLHVQGVLAQLSIFYIGNWALRE